MTVKYHDYLHKRCVVNPRKGPFHFRAPSRMLYRVIRGMVPHKLPRGAAALERLKVFEGIPQPYDHMKRVVVPDALRVLKLKPGRKYTVLGRLASEVGWKYADVVSKLEEKRKTKSATYYERQKAKRRLVTKAKQSAASKLTPVASTLEKYGYTL
jgi:large subunit ribosomal protein L13Ae